FVRAHRKMNDGTVSSKLRGIVQRLLNYGCGSAGLQLKYFAADLRRGGWHRLDDAADLRGLHILFRDAPEPAMLLDSIRHRIPVPDERLVAPGHLDGLRSRLQPKVIVRNQIRARLPQEHGAVAASI